MGLSFCKKKALKKNPEVKLSVDIFINKSPFRGLLFIHIVHDNLRSGIIEVIQN